jgi:hypothetical protein
MSQPRILLPPDHPLSKAAIAAVHALRSYQYGNASTELAEEIADALERALELAIDPL